MITFLKEDEQHQHNGGGWVANTATVEDTAYIGPNAQVYGEAQVSGEAQVFGNAQVSGKAWVFGEAQVSGEAQVFGNAQVSGKAWVFGEAQVSGNALVYGNAWVSGEARVFGDAWVETPLHIQGTRHGVSNSSHGKLSIGCITLTFAEWKKQYRAIGKREGYTANQRVWSDNRASRKNREVKPYPLRRGATGLAK